MKTAALLKPLVFLLSGFVLTSAAMANEGAAPAKPDLAKGQAISSQVCAACHTADGSRGAPTNPILQGQHPEYLAKQLNEFKSGVRNNAIMKGMASTLSDEDIKNVTAFYATKHAKEGFAKNKDTVALGEKIYRGGIADRQIPACAACHGPSGAGLPVQYPRLAGQHADYTEAQLNAFRAGTRTNNVQMAGVAAKMNDREIKAVADYIAGLR
ncbi:c-type cytochrome [Roseateles koreensis]|uniref:C-type cytochrome n=1 Tax=Roseateles koreensis TaxID=2987526 RepID=A0ABT5KQP5_9BURK|nr:c-type cytochrome [Roseateles koreensis]MDC8784790.1 c-type cytochrome [Roseateles koreensis]